MSSLLAQAQINLFRDSFDSTPIATVSLADAWQAIRTGAYHPQVSRVRRVLAREGKRAYDRAKAQLPAFTFGGTFMPSRGVAHLQQHSGLFNGDLDHLPDAKAAKRAICSDRRTALAFDSPSMTGLKISIHGPVVRDDAEYKRVWRVISAEYERLYGGAWDPSGKDSSRLCYASWDPGAYWNPEAEVFEVPQLPTQESPTPASPPNTPSSHTINGHYHDDYAVRAIKTAVQMIQAAPMGTRHHARLRASRLLGGFVIGGFLSYDQAYRVLEQALDGYTNDIAAALKTVEDGLRYGQAHPITLEALEAERQAWLGQHFARNHFNPANENPHRPAGTRYVWGARYHLGGDHAY
jgi:hypothetical protein